MTVALVYFATSLGTLLLLSVLYVIEDVRGQRIILPKFRLFLDRKLKAFSILVRRWCRSLCRGAVQFVLRHGVHRLLAIAVFYLRRLERRVGERVMHYKQPNTADVAEKKTRNHLDEIAEHKESVALSEEDRQRLRGE